MVKFELRRKFSIFGKILLKCICKGILNWIFVIDFIKCIKFVFVK